MASYLFFASSSTPILNEIEQSHLLSPFYICRYYSTSIAGVTFWLSVTTTPCFASILVEHRPPLGPIEDQEKGLSLDNHRRARFVFYAAARLAILPNASHPSISTRLSNISAHKPKSGLARRSLYPSDSHEL
jgi:hypothetical protein